LARFHLTRDAATSEADIRAARERLTAADSKTVAYAEITSNLAELLEASGRAAEARPLREEALQTFTTLYGANHPRTLRAAAALHN
jgi:hypothetical protein